MGDLVPSWNLPCATRSTGSEKDASGVGQYRRCWEAGASILDFWNFLELGSGLARVYASLLTIYYTITRSSFICLYSLAEIAVDSYDDSSQVK